MKRIISILIILTVMVSAGVAAFKLSDTAKEILTNVPFNWYESRTYYEIEKGNQFARERLENRFYIFLNNIFVDTGYDWDGEIYVPIRSISESLNWIVNWVPELGVIQLIKGEEEAYVDIVNFFGKGYVPLDRLENLLKLDRVSVHGGNIEINTCDNGIEIIGINQVKRMNFYINDMKMTDRAVEYKAHRYVPSKTFALSFGRVFRYDAERGKVYIDGIEIDSIFVDGQAYSTVEDLEKILDTGDAVFMFEEFRAGSGETIPVLSKGPEEKIVALTFDDYLGTKVYPLLDILDEYNVKATFFIIGNSIENNSEVLKQLVSRGHSAANHTWDHYNNHTLTDDEVRAQLISTRLYIQKYAGEDAPHFRPPGGYYDSNMLRIARDIGMQTVLWSLNSTDADPENSAGDIERTVVRGVHPGAIVTMHTNRDATIEALPGIIQGLRKKGYRFVTIPEMAKRQGREQ